MNKDMTLIRQWVSSRPSQGIKYGYQKIDWCDTHLTIRQLINYVRAGHNWTNRFTTDRMTKKTFQSTNCINLLVKSEMEMVDYLEEMEYQQMPMPTFAYYSSHEYTKDGLYPFRLVYCFEDELTAKTYPIVFEALARRIDYIPSQFQWQPGNAMVATYPGCDDYRDIQQTDKVYKTSDFI